MSKEIKINKHTTSLTADIDKIKQREEELEERCNKQWLKIQGDAEYIADLEAKLAAKDGEICRLQFEVQQALSNSLGKTIKELIEIDNQGKIELLEKIITIAKDIKGLDWCKQLCEQVNTLIKEIKGE